VTTHLPSHGVSDRSLAPGRVPSTRVGGPGKLGAAGTHAGDPDPAAAQAEPPGRRTALAASAAWVASVALLVVAVLYRIPVRDATIEGLEWTRLENVVDVVLTIVVVTVGVLIVLRGSSRRYGWLMVATGGTLALTFATGEYALFGWYVEGERGALALDVAIWLHEVGTWVGLGLIVMALPSLFPDGRPVGRWRRRFSVTAGLWATWGLLFVIADRPAENYFLDLPDAPRNPLGVLPEWMTMPLQAWWALLMIMSVVVSIGSLRARWRASVGEERQQLKWVLFGLAAAGVLWLLTLVEAVLADRVGVFEDEWITSLGVSVAWIGVMIAIGFALLRYRLYDIDLVINRTVVYAATSAGVIAVYALVVVGLTSLLPDISETGAGLAAAAAVALAFAPVRDEIQRRVDRLMFGRRSDPVGVIADVGTTLASSDAPDAALQAIVDTVVAALKVPGAAVELSGSVERPRVTAGDPTGSSESFPLRYQGDDVGRLVVVRRSPAEALGPADRQLLENVAHYAAGVAHTVELNRELQRSRERLVVAREEERRRLRRDLHDGLGPSLASQTFRLDAALAQLESDPTAAAGHLRALKEQNRELVADIRRLVYELRPPMLDELGLGGAIAAYAGQYSGDGSMSVSTSTSPDPLGDLPAAVEAAGYRIVTEAVTNAARHAAASVCRVQVTRVDHVLEIHVSDDGTGIPANAHHGVGLTSMRERTAELGGTLTVTAEPAGGTRVIAVLPVGSMTSADGRDPVGKEHADAR
jgi:signal transduction histidine kinase